MVSITKVKMEIVKEGMMIMTIMVQGGMRFYVLLADKEELEE